MQHRVGEVLRTKGGTVHSVTPDTRVLDAVRVMNRHNIGAILVMQDEESVGIFSERDVLTRVIDAGREPGNTRVDEVMTSNLITIPPTTTVGDALRMMTNRRIRHLPVMNDGTLMGLVSIGDLTKWVTKSLEQDLEQLETYISGPTLSV